ncbi:MAG: DUF6404 family protein [Aeromonas sp.]|uniref:DUF6404 family protein n=1 Tax=Aeromonas sp. TaxID=647 RepID=UPI003D6A1C1B
MTFEERLAAAHLELADKGVKALNYNPPLFRLLRKCGLKVKPPHYMSWLGNALWFGLTAGGIWSLFMWLVSWHGTAIDVTSLLSQIGLFVSFFGLTMATMLWFRRKQLKLTPWEQLPATTTNRDTGAAQHENP